MKIQTLSVVVGGAACNARCPFCVSRMTGPMNEPETQKENELIDSVNWRNLQIASRLAVRGGCTTAMLTSKGEPTLWPRLITSYLEALGKHFPILELQTNGITLRKSYEDGQQDHYLNTLYTLFNWYAAGLTTIAISTAHFDHSKNQEIYGKNYGEINSKLINILHEIGFSVRLCCIGIGGYIGDYISLKHMISFAKELKIEQLTYTSVNFPEFSADDEAADWVKKHLPQTRQIIDCINDSPNASKIMELSHGASVYDVDGQNVCINNCLNNNPIDDNIRNLIYFQDGHLRYRWDKKGAIIL